MKNSWISLSKYSWRSLIQRTTIRKSPVFDQIESHRQIFLWNSHKRRSTIQHSIIRYAPDENLKSLGGLSLSHSISIM